MQLPWWLVSVLSGLAAVVLLGLAYFLPSPYGWIAVAVFVVVTIYVLQLNPLHFYRNLAALIVESWLTLSAAAGIKAAFQFREGTFGFLEIGSAGTAFNCVVAVLVVVLLILDYLQTRNATVGIHNVYKRFKAAGPRDNLSLVEMANDTDRGKLALQLIQQEKEFFAVDTNNLTKKDQAVVAITQIENRAEELRARTKRTNFIIGGVFLVAIFLFRPLILAYADSMEPRERVVVVYFNDGERTFREPLRVDIRYGTHQDSETIADGKVTLQVPNAINTIQSISSTDPRYGFAPKGPYTIPPENTITVNAETIVEPPPVDPPSESIISDKPSKQTVLETKPAVKPQNAHLWYKNESDTDFTLFIFDFSSYYAGGQGYRYVFPLQRSNDFELWDRFSNDSSGWFGFSVRDAKNHKDMHLESRPIFDKESTYMTVKGSGGSYTVEFK